jgi:hypothetical protein
MQAVVAQGEEGASGLHRVVCQREEGRLDGFVVEGEGVDE